MTEIDLQAFSGCTNLTSIVIPDSVTTISFQAFYKCTNLKDVYYSGSESQWKSIDIDDSDNGNDPLFNATIHYNSPGSDPDSDKITVDTSVSHGKVTIDKETAKKGDTVTITAAPDKGYVTEKVMVMDKSGKEVSVKDNGDGKYSFTKPEGAVKISVIFKEIPASVNAPTASVKSGTYKDRVSVQLSSDNADAAIYYTTDGSQPTNKSTKYTGAITINATCILKAIAVVGSEVSPVAAYEYTIVTIGDANGDGDVDFADAIVVLKHDAGVSTLTGDKLKAADTNGDGEVDFVDAIQILKYDCDLISSFN